MLFKLLDKVANNTDEDLVLPPTEVVTLGRVCNRELPSSVLHSTDSQRTASWLKIANLAHKEACRYGHTETARALLEAAGEEAPDMPRMMLEYDQYKAFRSACDNGRTATAQMLLAEAEKIDEDLPRKMMEHDNYYAFQEATKNGHTDVARMLLEAAKKTNPPIMRRMFEYQQYQTFRYALQYGHTETVRMLLEEAEKMDSKLPGIILQKTGGHIAWCCHNGHTEAAQMLLKYAEEKIEEGWAQALLETGDYAAFRYTCQHNRLETAQMLLKEAKKTDKGMPRAMLEADNYHAFRYACKDGSRETVEMLLKEAEGTDKTLLRAMLEEDKFYAFRMAVDSGHTEIARMLLEKAGEIDETKIMQRAMLKGKENDYYDFWSTCNDGHTETAQMLLEEAGKIDRSMLRVMLAGTRGYYSAFRGSIEDGHTEVLRMLLEEAAKIYSGMPQAMMECAKYSLGDALRNDHPETALMLFEEGKKIDSPDYLRSMIGQYSSYPPFMEACKKDQIEIADMLLAEAKKIDKTMAFDMLKAEDCIGFRMASKNGCTEIMQRWLKIAEEIDPTLPQIMLRAENYDAFVKAKDHNNMGTALALVAAAVEKKDKDNMVQMLPSDAQAAIRADTMPKSQFWQHVGGGNDRWQAMTKGDAPYSTLAVQSPAYFKRSLYDHLLPLTQMACKLEKNEGAEMHAYRLAVLFSSPQEAEQYLDNYARGKWGNIENGSQLVHDALLFNIPQTGTWTPVKWKELTLKYGPAVTKYLGLAPRIEKYIAEKELDFPATSAELRDIVGQITYARSAENKGLAELALLYGLGEEQFNAALDILKTVKTRDKLPSVFIDGADIKHPGYYMVKMDASDPKGLMLGKITNCCQTIGNAGSDCAIHGATSENGAFYVWKQKTNGQITEKDPIVAQSWAWIGKDNTVVFDSFERLSGAYNKLAQPFLEQYAHEAKRKVHLGQGGNTPNLALSEAASPSVPLDYDGYRDSHKQYVIPAVNHYDRIQSHSIAGASK